MSGGELSLGLLIILMLLCGLLVLGGKKDEQRAVLGKRIEERCTPTGSYLVGRRHDVYTMYKCEGETK